MNCEHKNKAYIVERRQDPVVEENGEITEIEHTTVIVTYCADCGKKVKEVDAEL